MTNGRASEIVVVTQRHPRGFIMVPFTIPALVSFDIAILLNTGRPVSYLSATTFHTLQAFDMVTEIGPGRYRLSGLGLGDGISPDLDVRVSIGPRLLGVEGFLGLDFLGIFKTVRFERDSGLLALDA